MSQQVFPATPVVRFASFEVDLANRELRRSGLRLRLSEQPFRVLAMLLERPGELVTREQIQQRLWSSDTFVDFEHGLNAAIRRLRSVLGDRATQPRFIETLPKRGYRFVAALDGGAQLHEPMRRVIAVLPFVDARKGETARADDEYLVDGITETLIHTLSEIRELRVMARSTVFRFRGTDVDPVEAGRQLGAGAVVSGRVIVHGEQLSIDVELIDTSDGACMWGKRFDRRLSTIQEARDEIAAAIAEHLRVKLSAGEDRRLKRQPVANEAYRLYLQGRFWWNKRPQEGFLRGLEFFHKAIECDPLFALAWAGIADAYATLGSWESGLMAPQEAMPRAKAAAKRAIELDPQLADPWASLGYILLHHDWSWSESRGAFARAIELNPNCVNAHHWISHLYTARCEHNASFSESVRTSDLDPLDVIANIHLAWHHWLARDGDQVIRQSQKTASLEPASFWPAFFEGLGHELRGELDRAAEKLRSAVDRVPTATFALAALAHVHGRRERKAEALSVLEDLDRLAETRYVPSYDRALIFVGLKRFEEAFACLAGAVEERSGWCAYLLVDPRLDAIRQEKRFGDLLKRVGF